MSEEWGAPRPPSKSRRWFRWLGWTAAGFLVLLVLAYFIGTSSMFIRSFVLPRVSEAINATVTVSDTSVSPFFKVVLRGLKVQTSPTEEPVLTVREVRARYSLLDILHGRIHVDEVIVDSPLIHIIQYANGSTSLDPLFKPSANAAKPKPVETTPAAPPTLDVKSIQLTNATVQLVRFTTEGSDVVEISNLNLTVSDLANEGTPNLSLAAELKVDRKVALTNPNAPTSPFVWAGN